MFTEVFFLDFHLLRLRAAWGDPEGHLPLVQVRAQATVLDLASANALGEQVAAELRAGVLAQGGTLVLASERPDNA